MTRTSTEGKFRGSKLKIERAKEHIDQLNVEIGKFAKLNPYFVVVEPSFQIGEAKPNTKRCSLTVRIRKPIPERLLLIAGDAFHNLRSALDFLAGDLVRLNGRNGDNARFPFATDPKHLIDRIASTEIDKAGKKIVDIVLALEPYKGGAGKNLRALHDLDIEDKHISILQATPVPNNCKFGDEFNLTFEIQLARGSL